MLLVDVDHFKAYNDRYGHQAGDRALRHVAQVLQKLVPRPQDLLARYGGEEFAVLLYDLDAAEIDKLAQRMRKAVVGLALEHRDSGAGVVTISVGVAIVEPSLERHARGAVQLADEALYQVKTRGRNRVEILDSMAHRGARDRRLHQEHGRTRLGALLCPSGAGVCPSQATVAKTSGR